MEHEVLVPLSPQAVRRSLRRPELLSRCLPGFTPADVADPDGSVLAGRLKLRIGGSSITYRGTLRIEPPAGPTAEAGPDGGTADDVAVDDVIADDDASALVLTVAAQQAVGDGEVGGTVRVTVSPMGDGEGEDRSRILFSCEVGGKGRIEELDPQAVALASRRLLDRFCATFVVELDVDDPQDPQLFQELDGLPDLGDLGDFPGLGELADLSDLSELSDIDSSDMFLIEESVSAAGAQGVDETWTDEPGHRRSMVGRSAEEVDHAPPRGRYGPALPPRSARSRAAARWGGPERRMGEPPSADAEYSRMPWLVGGGVAIVGGAVLIARALRRR